MWYACFIYGGNADDDNITPSFRVPTSFTFPLTASASSASVRRLAFSFFILIPEDGNPAERTPGGLW